MDPSDIFASNKTTLEDILNLKKDQIILYLRSRKQKISGNKQEIAVRALNFLRTEFGLSDSLIQSGSNESVQIHSENENIPNIKELNSGWTSDPVHIPKLKVQDIEKYLIYSSHRTSDSLKMECYRQYIRGLNFYKENYIHKVMINNISETSNHCYIRSKCHPSMKQGVYTQWVLMTKAVPITILKASCTCPAGLGEGCTHISGLLFAIEGTGSVCGTQENPACTSKPCEWNKPSKRKREAQPVEKMPFKKIKLHETETKPKLKNPSGKLSEEKLSSFRDKLCSRLGNQSNAVIFDLLPPVANETAVESDLNVAQDITVETSERIIHQSDKYINLKETVHDLNMSSSDFLEKMSTCDSEVVAEIEMRTRGQNENALWVQSRRSRITASIFHDILTRKDTTPSQKIVDSILSDAKHVSLNVPAVKWGRKMEIVAKKNYIAIKKLKFNQNIKIIEQGLHVHQHYSFLGASPDGMVVENEEKYLIEIKCPYKWRFKTVSEACNDADFSCYTNGQGQILLKDSHIYYTQIQGQMGVSGVKKCNLIIYTTKDIQVLTINFYPEFWGILLEKLKQFYCQNVPPRLTN